jgi:hypothetical protein
MSTRFIDGSHCGFHASVPASSGARADPSSRLTKIETASPTAICV